METLIADTIAEPRWFPFRFDGRKLFIGLRNSRTAELGFDQGQLFQQSDLQLAALAWLAIQRTMADSASRFGRERVASVTSGDLFGRPEETLTAVAAHLKLLLNVDQKLKTGLFRRHAKTGEPFDAAARARGVADALQIHGEEIRLVAEWARKVAEANSIAWDLPYPLLPAAV